MTTEGNDTAGSGADTPTRDDLRRLEARLDARLQEINARIILHDGRFAAIGDRINQTDRRGEASSARNDSRLRAMDRHLDSIDTRFDTMAMRLDSIEESVNAIKERLNGTRRLRRRARRHGHA